MRRARKHSSSWPTSSRSTLDRAARGALGDAASSPVLQADIQIRLASAIRFREGFVKAHERAVAALELAERLDDDSLRVAALAVLADLGAAMGDEEAPAQAARALELAGESGRPRLEHVMAYVALIPLGDETQSIRRLLEDDYERWRDRDEPRSADALWELSLAELEAGSWELAADHAARARDIASQYGIEIPQHHLPIAWIAVHRGQLDLARRRRCERSTSRRRHLGLHPPYHLAVIGLVALWRGDASTGAEWLGRAHSRALELGWFEPAQPPVDRRLRRGAARARADRRGRGSPRQMGGRRAAARSNEDPRAGLRCRGSDRSRPRSIDEAMALLEEAVSSTASSAIRTGRLVRSSRSASSVVVPGRNARPATRSPRRSQDSSSSAQ